MSPRFRNTFDLGVGEFGRPEWHLHAACRGVGADQYFNNVVTREALARCASCPVAVECREQGERETFGAWAGHLSVGQRLPKTRKPAKRRKRTVRPSKPRCGSQAGYLQHKRDGDEVCDDCLEAHNKMTREWKRRARIRRLAKNRTVAA